MKPTYHDPLVPHILIEDFLSPDDLKVFNEDFYKMYPFASAGSIVRDGERGIVDKSFKARKEFEIYPQTDEHKLRIPQIWHRNLWSDELRRFYANQSGLFAYMNVTSSDMLLGAFYGEGDFYQTHADLSIFTAVFFHQNEANFDGGDFMLGTVTEWNRGEAIFVRIPYKCNKLLIFPSRFIHHAEPVTKSNVSGLDGLRLCTQNFLGFDNDYNK